MKNSILIFLLAISLIACSNNIPVSKIPSVVLNTFNAEFPRASHSEWERSGGNFEAEFEIDSLENQALFSASGEKLMEKKEISITELPASVSTSLRNNFKFYVADEIEQVLKEGVTYYQIELETKGKADRKIVFAADGSQHKSLKFWD